MTVPAWVWEVSAATLFAAVVAEILITRLPGRASFTARSAVSWVGVYVSLAVIFGIAVGITAGWVTAGQFYTGYLTEYSLSLDNLFIFYVIMGWFSVPPSRQHRVLLLGIGLALVLRSVLIVAGAAALNRFGWLFYPLGGILVWTAIGLITSGQDSKPERHTRLLSWLQRRVAANEDPGHRLIARQSGRWVVTPMLLLTIAIGMTDVLFAVDSIPAIFGITTSAYLVVACNAFALMGLRQLYALIARFLERIVYLNTGLGIICAFIGMKLLLHALHESGARWATEIPAWLSVIVVAAVLVITLLAGMISSNRARKVLGRRFAVLDIDEDGAWQRHDYERLALRLCEAFGHAADSAEGRAMDRSQRALFAALLSHMDADGDQEVSEDEFIAAIDRTIKDRPGFDAAVRLTAGALIQVADQDGNGVLDPAEYARLASVFGTQADNAALAFDRLDQDQNGVLDTAELALAISQFFTNRGPGACGFATGCAGAGSC